MSNYEEKNNETEDSVVKEFRIKKKANWWLLNEIFLDNNNFEDKYYLKILCQHLNEFLKDIPVPVLTTFDRNHNRIYFSIGEDSHWLRVSNDISFFDYITQVKRWVSHYFPQYEVDVEEEIDLSEEEVLEKVQQGADLNELALLKKKVIIKEKGIITRIALSQDRFEFVKNGIKTIRMSGDIDNILPLSIFLKQLRILKNENAKSEQIREFIFKNSEEIERVDDSNEKIIIDYSPKMMKNFFIIRFADLKDQQIKKNKSTEMYDWGRYSIKFESESSELDCIQYVKDRRKEKGIVMEIEND
jgi:hypothetical protein